MGNHSAFSHDNIGLVSWIQIWRPFSFDHYESSIWYIITCTVHPDMSHVYSFYAIPIFTF